MKFWSILATLGHSGPLNGSPRLVYHSILLPSNKISKKIMNICCLSELDGSKIKNIQDFGQFKPFLALWDCLVGPPGGFILVLHSLLLSQHQISVTITKSFYLSEMDGGQIQKNLDFGQFWPFLVLWGPRGVPQEPPPLILEVHCIRL